MNIDPCKCQSILTDLNRFKISYSAKFSKRATSSLLEHTTIPTSPVPNILSASVVLIRYELHVVKSLITRKALYYLHRSAYHAVARFG